MGNEELQFEKKFAFPADSARKAPGAHTSSPCLCPPDKQGYDVISKGDVASWRALSIIVLAVAASHIWGHPPRWGAQFCCMWRRGGERAAGPAYPPSPFLCSAPYKNDVGAAMPQPGTGDAPGSQGQGPSCRPFTSLTSRRHHSTDSPIGVPLIAATPRGSCNLNSCSASLSLSS